MSRFLWFTVYMAHQPNIGPPYSDPNGHKKRSR